MEKNNELRTAWDFVEHTGISIFLTGKAGTGKTTFLRVVKKHSKKRIIVVAPTGVAAINAGGVTIHSFFQLPLSPFVPEARIESKFNFSKEKRKILRTLDLLIIDEISMVRADTLDAIDSVLRRFRNHTQPFGGVQLLMIGDLQQLTPVVRPNEEDLLQKYYDTPYFFSSQSLKNIQYVTIELNKVYRQQDNNFVSILNHIRCGLTTPDDLRQLNQRYIPGFTPPPDSGYIRLTTHNRMAHDYNRRELRDLSDREYTFTAETSGQFPDYNYPADYELKLKRNAQVMFIHNDPDGKYYNGRIGYIVEINEKQIKVLCSGDTEAIDVQSNTWENTKYTLNEQTKQIQSEVLGTFTQYPLRLAWAITIHKSQGLTFQHAIIEAQQAFASGQVYVALSRCRTLEGLVLSSPIDQNAIINDSRVSSYIGNQTQQSRESIKRLPELKESYYRILLLELFDFKEIKRDETALFRVVSEFYHKYPKVQALHKTALSDLDERILSVASKWEGIISAMSNDKLHSMEFLERVKKSALYFYGELTELFEHLIELTKALESNNKMGTRRFQLAFSDLKQTYLAKKLLLETIMRTGFTTSLYLKAKQEAILSTLPEDGKRKRKTKERKEKAEPKEKTQVVTYKLFRQGKSPETVANERGLTLSTIQRHLSRYIATGEIHLEEIVGNEKANYLRRIIKGVNTETNLTAIKNICREDVSYGDIRMALAEKDLSRD